MVIVTQNTVESGYLAHFVIWHTSFIQHMSHAVLFQPQLSLSIWCPHLMKTGWGRMQLCMLCAVSACMRISNKITVCILAQGVLAASFVLLSVALEQLLGIVHQCSGSCHPSRRTQTPRRALQRVTLVAYN